MRTVAIYDVDSLIPNVALMKQAVNKLHTVLHVIFTGDRETQDAAWEVLNRQYPNGWDTPEFDQGLLRDFELTKAARRTQREGKAAKEGTAP